MIANKFLLLRQLIIQLIKQFGVINTGLYSINRLCDRFSIPLLFTKYYFVAQIIMPDPMLPAGKGKQLDTVELTDSQQDKHPCPRPVPVIKDRYAQGAICLATYKNEEFAGCFWYAKQRYKEDEVRCLYELSSEDAVWDFDIYVEPKYRLSPVFLKLWDEASIRLLSEGYHWSLSRISAFNSISLSSHKRMGAQFIGWAFFMSISRFQLTLSNFFPFVHISFNFASFPVFKLKTPN